MAASIKQTVLSTTILLLLVSIGNSVLTHLYFENSGWQLHSSEGLDVDYDADWLFRSIACAPSTALAPPGQCTQVYGYDATSQKWLLWDASRADEQNDITELSFQGYWFNVPTAGHTEDIATPAISQSNGIINYAENLVVGWNLMGWTNGQSQTVSYVADKLKSDYDMTVVDVQTQDNSYDMVSTQYWNKDYTNAQASFEAGKGYWICVKDPSNDKDTYCDDTLPPLMPWQNQRPTLTNPAAYTMERFVPDTPGGNGNGQSGQGSQGQGQGQSQSGGQGEGSNQNGNSDQSQSQGQGQQNTGHYELWTTFAVTYADAESEPATTAQLVLNNKVYDLKKLGADYKQGVSYYIDLQLVNGTYPYSFQFSDGHRIVHKPKNGQTTIQVGTGGTNYVKQGQKNQGAPRQNTNSGASTTGLKKIKTPAAIKTTPTVKTTSLKTVPSKTTSQAVVVSDAPMKTNAPTQAKTTTMRKEKYAWAKTKAGYYS